MIDTVRLYQPMFKAMDKGFIYLKNFNLHHWVSGEMIYINTFYNSEGKQPITVKYDELKDYVTITFSVPKLVYGNSIKNFTHEDYDKNLLLDVLTERLRGIIETDFLDMLVSRLDIAINIVTDYNVDVYIKAVRYCLDISKRYRVQEYKDSSLTIYNRSKRILFYDKEKEQIRSKEIGFDYQPKGNLLRFEVQLKDMKMVKNAFGFGSEIKFDDALEYPVVLGAYLVELFETITKDYALSDELREFQSDLGLIKAISENRKRNILSDFLILKHVRDFDIDKYEPLLLYVGFSQRSIYNMKNKLKELEAMYPVNNSLDLVRELHDKILSNLRELVINYQKQFAKS